MLDLPANLMTSEIGQAASFGGNSMLSLDSSSSTGPNGSRKAAMGSGTAAISDNVRGNSTSRSLKIINVVVEVLRVLSTNRLIGLRLDDLQNADGETLELISSVVTRKLGGLVLLITCRDEDSFPAHIKSVLDGRSANVTRIQLSPLKEEDVVNFVAKTLHREKDYVAPLAMVCLDRCNGNPFFLRQMLEVCHQRGCIWYTWKLSAWEFDLDKVFREFEVEAYGQTLDHDFLTKRLRDLPSTARAILAWASLLGGTFSFGFLQQLLKGDCKESDETVERTCRASPYASNAGPVENIVEGLNACLQALVLVPGEDEDHFSFSHDRYVQASGSLRECHDAGRMHFLIARTMMSANGTDTVCFSCVSRPRSISFSLSRGDALVEALGSQCHQLKQQY